MEGTKWGIQTQSQRRTGDWDQKATEHTNAGKLGDHQLANNAGKISTILGRTSAIGRRRANLNLDY